MHIGLIGGIGPAATEVYYRALVRAFADAGRKLHLTIVHADAAELIANLEAGRNAEQAAIFARFVDQLRAGGCDFAAVTSMGGHFCIKELEAISSLPLANAVSALDTYFAARNVERIGVMGTRAVMESRLYGLSSVAVVVPPVTELASVHQAYVTIAKAGSASPEHCAYFHDVGLALHRDQGAQIVVLGGTDLSLAFGANDPGYPIADSALIHADAIARRALAAG